MMRQSTGGRAGRAAGVELRSQVEKGWAYSFGVDGSPTTSNLQSPVVVLQIYHGRIKDGNWSASEAATGGAPLSPVVVNSRDVGREWRRLIEDVSGCASASQRVTLLGGLLPPLNNNFWILAPWIKAPKAGRFWTGAGCAGSKNGAWKLGQGRIGP
jgi:hypothetical protein